VETLKGISERLSVRSLRVSLVGFSDIVERVNRGERVICMLGHCGNWELLSLLPKLLGIRVIAPYRILRPKCLDRVVYRIRVRFGMLLIPDIHIGRYFLRDGYFFFFIIITFIQVSFRIYHFQ
jgi:KDO2-lipid IV(A) lauroyltransferase